MLHKAIEFAGMMHNGQMRKYPPATPYLTHLSNVALLLQRAGYADEVVAAGLLHDVLEDTNCKEDRLREEFGDKITGLVLAVSENKDEKDWILRKQMYREKISFSDMDAVALAAADHLHNAKSMILAIKSGLDIKTAFSIGLNERLEHEKLLVKIIKDKLGNAELVLEFEDAVTEWESLMK
jgi:(p)ppGpp synthase/HD superfamily hydrolase